MLVRWQTCFVGREMVGVNGEAVGGGGVEALGRGGVCGLREGRV